MISRCACRRAPGSPGAWSAPPCTRSGWASSIQREELQRVEARRAEHLRRPRDSGASRPAIRPWMWNSGMMLRPRSAAVRRERGAHVAGRGADVALGQRHDLRPRRRARSVQDQRDVVRLRRRRSAGGGWPRAVQRRQLERARRRMPASGVSCSDRHAEPPRHLDRRRCACPPRRSAAVACEVGQVELELLGAVGGIERRRRAARGRREKAHRHLRTVGQHDGDAIVAASAQAAQRLQRSRRGGRAAPR